MSVSAETLTLKFLGWHDIASYDANRVPIAEAVKHYEVVGQPGWSQLVYQATKLPTGSPIAAEILSLAWQVALTTKDIERTNSDETTTMVSFFEDSVPVTN